MNRPGKPHGAAARRALAAVRGMTLVEILIALAIAALMTLTGWRAIDALQRARDQVQADAAQWQQLDDFFVTLEADLRRSELLDFQGESDHMTLLQPDLDGGADVTLVRYRLAAASAVTQPPTAAAATAEAAPVAQVLRETSRGGAATPMATVVALGFAYSSDGTQFETASQSYPRAVRIRVTVPGTVAPVERLLALR